MRKIIPVLGAGFILGIVLLAVSLAANNSILRLPNTSGVAGAQDVNTTGASGSSSTSGSGGGAPASNTNKVVQDTLSRLFGRGAGLPAGSEKLVSSSSATGSTPTPSAASIYRLAKIFGVNISGLEFSGLFQANSEQTYTYFRSQGMNTVRIPFDWNELQPDLYGSFDPTSKQYLDQNIAWAKKHDLSVILDVHNYGRRYIYRDGGFSDDFSSGQQHTFQLPYGDQDSTAATLTFRDFGRGVAGTGTNPGSASGYRTSFEAKIDSANGDAWNEFYMDTFYQSENNRYSLVINPVINHWEFRQTVDGKTTTLAAGDRAWTIGQYYSFTIDINQASPGKINVTVDGAPLFTANSVNSTPALSHGKISLFPAGVKATIRHFVLNVAGDTTSGGPVERRVGDGGLSLDAWKDFWTRMGQAYQNEPAVIGYDQNEPHDMPIPTTPLNYSDEVASSHNQPVATASAMGQSMVDALRAAGDDKFVVVEMDHWANTHQFTTQYGANPKPWVNDPLGKVAYSGHYYFDSDHSGIYPPSSTPPSGSSIEADVMPFFQWCEQQAVVCYEGEFGVPNTVEWQPALTHLLKLMRQYHIWWTQWAGGDIYSSPTTLQPTNSFTTDRLQMTSVRNFLAQP